MRLFFAISPDPAARAQLARGAALVRDAALPGTRSVTADNLHMTLQFLGELDAAALQRLQTAARAVSSVTAPLVLQLHGAGGFPTDAHAKVIWVGLARATPPLHALAARLAGACRQVGVVPEDRAYHPHVTLAYLKQALNVRPLAAALDRALAPVTLSVSEVQLIESHKQQGGARYALVATFPLGG